MKKLTPFLGAALFFIVAQVVMRAYGLTDGIIAGVAMVALWLASYLWKERVMDRLWHQLAPLNMALYFKRDGSPERRAWLI